MTDREMLELAAKAAVLTIDTHHVDGGAFVWEGEMGESDWNPQWNPLANDGDALRLAVKLELHNAVRDGYQHLDSDGDIYAATRRAIVRAAAEIGKAMP